jgi:hypothetical protein
MKGTMSVDAMTDLAPKLFKAAKVLEVTRGYNPTKAIDNLVEMTHQLHDYSPKRMSGMLDLMLGASELISQDPQKLKTQMGYFASGFKNAGISDKDIFASIVMASRAGMGQGKGGTSLQNFLSAVLGQADITSFRAALRKSAVQKITGGAVDKFYYSDKPGDPKTLHIMDMIQNVAKYAQAHPGYKVIPEFTSAFGVQGSRFASLMADPETVRAFAGTRAALNDPNMSVNNLYKTVMDNYKAQASRAGNSFSILGASLTPSLMPSLTNVARSFADMMNGIAATVRKNPQMLDGIRHMLDSVANAFVSFGKAMQTNPQFVHGLGEMTYYLTLLAGIKFGLGALSWIGQVTMLSPALVLLGRAAMPLIRALVLAAGIGGASMVTALALPAAVAAILAGIGAALLFPKQLKAMRDAIGNLFTHIFEDFTWGLGFLAHKLQNAIADWFKSLLNMNQDAGKPYTGVRNALGQPDPLMDWMLKNKFGLTWLQTHTHVGAGWDAASPSPAPSVKHIAPHAKTAQAHTTTVHIAFNAPVYGMDDFKKQVSNVLQDIAKNPMSVMGTNLSATRTHANIPQALAVGTA